MAGFLALGLLLLFRLPGQGPVTFKEKKLANYSCGHSHGLGNLQNIFRTVFPFNPEGHHLRLIYTQSWQVDQLRIRLRRGALRTAGRFLPG